jgi:ribosomal protein S18 acetylase RimI-like enzyme
MSFVIRDAMKDDLPRLESVFRRSTLSNEGDRAALLDHPEALTLSATSLSGRRVRVVTTERDLIAGFASTVTEDGFLELVDLFTDPAWMRQGVATMLIDDVVAFAATIGIGRISVVENRHASGFYRRAGFAAESLAATDFGLTVRSHLTTPT